MTLLVVTAVAAEAEALLRGMPAGHPVTVTPVGVGPAAAAAGTARLLALAGSRYRAVVSAGIAGGFGVEPGGTVLGARSIAADLGAQAPESDTGFISVDDLGFGTATLDADRDLLAALRRVLPEAAVGDVLTLSTVTGTAETARELVARHPLALAEAMEGYGVACAAEQAGVPFAELRAISNPVGPRDRASWRIGDALSALTAAAPHLAALTGSW
ncbi:futalosine hydrolase [Catellatospora sp. KI3]|uniref:futalosine hydrolase n=1 Tax=Catellatospora sp. KI3 TaxID=3041620 RepID=UPI002482C427|nr:futalosine hydrolase [Catellatospora sp. KI3]MDI1461967.1 futalosine hydrolase [Catellatospora sp. KI3]